MPVISRSPIGIAERLPHAVAESVPVPVDVVRAVLDGIADRRDLHVRKRDPPHQLADGLGATSDERERDLVAWSDISGTTEHVSRHDAERRYACGGRGQELATIDVVRGCHGDHLPWESVQRLRGVPVRHPAPDMVLRVSSARSVGRCYSCFLVPNMARAAIGGYSRPMTGRPPGASAPRPDPAPSRSGPCRSSSSGSLP